MRKQTFWFPTWYDTNQAVQLQKMASGLKFRIKKVEGLYYLSRGRTGLVVRASDSGSGDPGSILGRDGVLFPWARDIYSPHHENKSV